MDVKIYEKTALDVPKPDPSRYEETPCEKPEIWIDPSHLDYVDPMRSILSPPKSSVDPRHTKVQFNSKNVQGCR